MIRINLLGVERQKAKAPTSFDLSRQVPAACVAIMLATAGATGWWYWSLGQESLQVDNDRAAADSEVVRLQTLMAEVAQFEARSKQLQDRVQLIERLRAGQGVPVLLLDHISRSLPDMLWLTELKQNGGEVTLQGRSTTLIALSDFVGNLGSNPMLQKPIEIVNSQVEAGKDAKGPSPDLISFTVRAQLAGAAAADGAGGKKKGRA